MTMKRTFSILALLILLINVSNSGFGQASMSFQYSSLSKLGIAYNFSPRVWSELRIYSNTFIEDITAELAVLYNVSVKDQHEFYIGIGAVANYFSGMIIPIGLQFRPIENFKRFSLQIEFEPTIDIGNENLALQSSAGIRYTFGKK